MIDLLIECIWIAIVVTAVYFGGVMIMSWWLALPHVAY